MMHDASDEVNGKQRQAVAMMDNKEDKRAVDDKGVWRQVRQ